jgi:nitrogen fixation/metabolism regulation signal transduction histidine kinase
MGILLVNELGRIVYGNVAARRLLGASRRLIGRDLSEVAAASPEPMRRALFAEQDALFTVPAREAGEEETYRVVRRRVQLNTVQHRLIVLERMTPELRRQEVEVWKKVIRVMSHELNNSLAPVSSLLHSARHVAGRADRAHRIEEILDAADERVRHLSEFLEGYAQFARLPRPRKEAVVWRPFLESVQGVFPFRITGELPREPARFDPGQLQQVLINLLKNAAESGSPEGDVAVAVEITPQGTLLHVFDRGKGMDDETMRMALLPFYSSKQSGTGLGLPLCTEILSAHGGGLRVQRRSGGGTVVTCILPTEEA